MHPAVSQLPTLPDPATWPHRFYEFVCIRSIKQPCYMDGSYAVAEISDYAFVTLEKASVTHTILAWQPEAYYWKTEKGALRAASVRDMHDAYLSLLLEAHGDSLAPPDNINSVRRETMDNLYSVPITVHYFAREDTHTVHGWRQVNPNPNVWDAFA